MTITESNELQAIMALDDEGISSEINRKGQVSVKKKDLKKAPAPDRLRQAADPYQKIVPLPLVEQYTIESTLDKCNGDVVLAAKKLQIGQATLYRKIKRYGIKV